MTMRFWRVIALVACVATLAWKGYAADAGGRWTKLLVGHLPVTGHAKFFVAKERGYFSDEGLDVELISYTNSPDGLAAIRAGMLDVGAFGTVSPLVYIAAGTDVRIIGGLMGEDAYLVAGPKVAGEIRELADLRGRRVATVRFSSGDIIMRWGLRRAGLSWENDMTLIELNDPLSALRAVKNGQAEVGMIWGPFDLKAEEQGLTVVMATADLMPGHPCCRLVVTADRFRDKKLAWPRFLRALLRAERFVGDSVNRNVVIADVGRYLEMKPEDIDRAYFNGRVEQTSDPNSEAVEMVWNIMLDAEFIGGQIQVRDHIELEPFEEALASLERENPEEGYWRKVRELYESRNHTPQK